jgi:hypothetical protein
MRANQSTNDRFQSVCQQSALIVANLQAISQLLNSWLLLWLLVGGCSQ